jgi:hypothetical protein
MGTAQPGIEVLSAPVASLQANPNCERVIVPIDENARSNDSVIQGGALSANMKSRVWQ